MGGQRQASAALLPVKTWWASEAVRRAREISLPTETGSSHCPGRSESLYWLSHPDSLYTWNITSERRATRSTQDLRDHPIVFLHISKKYIILMYTVLHPSKCHWLSCTDHGSDACERTTLSPWRGSLDRHKKECYYIIFKFMCIILCFLSLKSCIHFMYMNQQDAQNSCD